VSRDPTEDPRVLIIDEIEKWAKVVKARDLRVD
jgi:hypothetical protein